MAALASGIVNGRATGCGGRDHGGLQLVDGRHKTGLVGSGQGSRVANHGFDFFDLGTHGLGKGGQYEV
ncbi:hypothetical protein [Paludibacterium denitrificans]|uniref:hypothetical protein n=1 Tax=Paludibacterium denitrificans TaxID=2675226 RepID=UPI001E3B1BC6|nr:hypothetical protein [Paludibacterium denitrificans]